jgi:hypothetical protein
MTTPMSTERFADRFRYFKGQAQQLRGVQQLFNAIAASDQGSTILDEQAPWALPYSEQPPAPVGGLDPRGSEEVGMAGPQKPAPVQPDDSYLLVNDRDEDMEAYDHRGQLLWKIPCLARDQGADTDLSHTNTDTPPGLYKLGKLYTDVEQNPNPPCSDTAMGYGWYSFDMEELEGQEAAHGRAGIMLHGSGSACGWPGAWAPQQPLHPTLGCIRLHNADLRDKVLDARRDPSMWGKFNAGLEGSAWYLQQLHLTFQRRLENSRSVELLGESVREILASAPDLALVPAGHDPGAYAEGHPWCGLPARGST